VTTVDRCSHARILRRVRFVATLDFTTETTENTEKDCELVARASRETDREGLRSQAPHDRAAFANRSPSRSIRRPKAGATRLCLCDLCDLCVEETHATPRVDAH
jgi:hypothetical protein